MDIVVNELKTSSEQQITVTTRIVLKAVRPHIYKHLSPTGTFTLSVLEGATTLASKSLTSADMESGSSLISNTNYYHGYINYEFDNPIVLNAGTYVVKLEASGYTFAESAYIGWVQEHEGQSYTISGTPSGDFENPMSLELWSYGPNNSAR